MTRAGNITGGPSQRGSAIVDLRGAELLQVILSKIEALERSQKKGSGELVFKAVEAETVKVKHGLAKAPSVVIISGNGIEGMGGANLLYLEAPAAFYTATEFLAVGRAGAAVTGKLFFNWLAIE